MQTIEKYINTNGKRLYSKRWLPETEASLGELPVLVLLHEGLGSVALWKNVPEQLALRLGLEVFAYDRQGYGLSDRMDLPRPMDYLQREAFEWLPSVLEQAGMGERPPVLFGHSDGGSIALLYASRHPCSALVVESAHVYVEPVTLAGIETAKQAFRDTDIRSRLQRYHGDKVDDLFDAWANTWLHPSFADWNIEAFLPRIQAPALILQGELDEYATPAHVESIVSGLSGGNKRGLLLPGAAHIPHFQASQVVLDEVSRWLQDVLSLPQLL